MKGKIIILLLVVFCSVSYAQDYPMEVLPGKTIRLNAKSDSLWVIKNSDYVEYQTCKTFKHGADSIFSILKRESDTYRRVISQKNDMIKKKGTEYMIHKEKWEKCEIKLEEEEKLTKKAKTKNKLFGGVGLVTGIVLGFVVSLFM